MDLVRLTPSDAPEAADLLHAAHAWNLGHGFNFWAATAGVEEVRRTLARHLGLGLHAGGQLIAMAVLRRDGEGTHLSNLAVHPAMQGCGLGRRLVREAEELARRLGVRELLLDTPADHPWLPAYYRRLGYREYGVARFPGRRYVSVLMRKAL